MAFSRLECFPLQKSATRESRKKLGKANRNGSKGWSRPAIVFVGNQRIEIPVLEGMVCKRKNSPYRATENPSPYWIKVKNPRYSQLEGREELLERQ